MKYGIKLDVVNFYDYVAMGKSLDPQKFVQDGSRIDTVNCKVYTFNDTFLCVEFCGLTPDKQYKQLIPWSACSAVYSTALQEIVEPKKAKQDSDDEPREYKKHAMTK